jgi:plasmid stability protein
LAKKENLTSMIALVTMDSAKEETAMASITIRDLPDSAKDTLRVHAAKAGVSLEAYAREVLHAAARNAAFIPATDLVGLSRSLFGAGKGVDLELPSRRSSRPVVEFDR